jgi:hypothetical protein
MWLASQLYMEDQPCQHMHAAVDDDDDWLHTQHRHQTASQTDIACSRRTCCKHKLHPAGPPWCHQKLVTVPPTGNCFTTLLVTLSLPVSLQSPPCRRCNMRAGSIAHDASKQPQVVRARTDHAPSDAAACPGTQREVKSTTPPHPTTPHKQWHIRHCRPGYGRNTLYGRNTCYTLKHCVRGPITCITVYTCGRH